MAYRLTSTFQAFFVRLISLFYCARPLWYSQLSSKDFSISIRSDVAVNVTTNLWKSIAWILMALALSVLISLSPSTYAQNTIAPPLFKWSVGFNEFSTTEGILANASENTFHETPQEAADAQCRRVGIAGGGPPQIAGPVTFVPDLQGWIVLYDCLNSSGGVQGHAFAALWGQCPGFTALSGPVGTDGNLVNPAGSFDADPAVPGGSFNYGANRRVGYFSCEVAGGHPVVYKNLGTCCTPTANPINPVTGNKYQVEVDYPQSSNLNLKFERTYC